MTEREKGRRKDPAHVSMFLRGIPRATRNAFKAWCELHEITMTRKFIELMKRTIQET